VALSGLAACGLQSREDAVPRPTIEEVQEAHTEEWLALPGVVGTGIGLCDDDEPCIRVLLAYPSPDAEAAIPDRVEGYRVELVVTGPVRPRTPPDSGRTQDVDVDSPRSR
jgi:hypothetical protein